MIEIVVALFFVTLVTFLIGGLAQQVNQFTKKTKQLSAILELRTKIGNLSKDPDLFVSRMLTVPMPGTAVLYQNCLPSPSNLPSPFNCPAVKPGFLNSSSPLYDAGLKERATNVFKVVDTTLVDSRGKKIAGTLADPFYLTSDGLECSATPKESKCPLMSTGYFLRSNDATDQDPGDVKFVVKVETNANSGTSPIKPQYLSIDLEAARAITAASACPGDAIQVGVRRDGSPMCLLPINCGPGSLLVGVTSTGAPDCKNIPACPDTKRIVLNDDSDLECVGNSPCDVGEAHLGYFTGTSDPICSSPTSCADDEILLGSTCKKLDTCLATETLTFINNSFACKEAASVSNQECKGQGEFLVGFDANGKAKCERGLAGEDGKDGSDGKNGKDGSDGEKGADATVLPNCEAGEILIARASGGFRCGPKLPDCKEGQGIVADADGNFKCVDFFPDCKPGQIFVVKSSGSGLSCANLPQTIKPEAEPVKPKTFILRYEASQHNPAGSCASRHTRSCSYDLVSVDNNSVGKLTTYSCPQGHTAKITSQSRKSVNIPVSGGTVSRPLFGTSPCISSGGTTSSCPDVDLKATLTCTAN